MKPTAHQFSFGLWRRSVAIACTGVLGAVLSAPAASPPHWQHLASANGDGHLDIFAAEMAQWTENRAQPDYPDATAWIFYGDGFRKTESIKGQDWHETRLADLDGDGDLDLLNKPYTWQTPRVDVWLNNGTGPRHRKAAARESGASSAQAASTPLALHPDNPHYFLFRGQPTLLITSGEHYGAVLNLDFDFRRYLDTLAKDGLNLTRTFSGAYCEKPGNFNIAGNTLAPLPGRFICPWARSATAGYANGGNKFDLERWDSDYFARVKSFLEYARQRGVVVELNLFCPFYDDSMWRLSPMNSANNINGLGAIARTNVYTLDRNGGLLAVQEAMVRKLVTELNGFDNLYYEICNEPYFGGVTLEWQGRIAEVIAETERSLPRRHLISQNIANGRAKVQHPHPAVSIFNFHYAMPPDTVALNFGLNKVIGDNETGFKGTNDTHYRKEAWQFILAGGGLYNNLDYSFTAGREDGTFVYPARQPGGGTPRFRRQMHTLAQFMREFDFIRMKPDNSVLRGGLPDQARAYALVEPGKQYAVYVFGGAQANLQVELPAGQYRVEWLNPVTGKAEPPIGLKHPGGVAVLKSPDYSPDIALRIVSVSARPGDRGKPGD